MKRHEAVFKVAIDYPYSLKKEGIRLSQSFSNKNLDFEFPSYRRVQEIASRVILQELPKEISEIYSLKIKTRIIAEREGSVLVYFGAVTTTYMLIGGYSSFINSLELITEHTQELLRRAFNEEFPHELDISVDRKSPARNRRMIGSKEIDLLFEDYYDLEVQIPRRKGSTINGKGFFLYLLFMNIALLLVVGTIAYKAIVIVYFGFP